MTREYASGSSKRLPTQAHYVYNEFTQDGMATWVSHSYQLDLKTDSTVSTSHPVLPLKNMGDVSSTRL